MTPKSAQNGHIIPRNYKILRYDERNVRPQCFICNVAERELGKILLIDKFIEKGMYGTEFKPLLEIARANPNHIISASRLKMITQKYEKEIEHLLKEKDVKRWWSQ